MAKKAMTAEEKKHVSRAVSLGCIACRNMGIRDSPAEWHHIRATAGAGQRSNHKDGIPLCPTHHRNGGYEVSIHSGRQAWEAIHGSELELLQQIKQLLNN